MKCFSGLEVMDYWTDRKTLKEHGACSCVPIMAFLLKIAYLFGLYQLHIFLVLDLRLIYL